MFSKEEKKEFNIEFWGLFKRQMRRHMSSNGKRINWLKYPTEIKHTYLRLETNTDFISVHFDIQIKDSEIRELFWDQILELKGIVDSKLGHKSEWIENVEIEGVFQISRISWKKEGLSYYNKNQWPEIFDFFKSVLIDFDRFYQEFKDVLINLLD